MMPSPYKEMEISDKYDLYSTLDEWRWLHDCLLCIHSDCSPWMAARKVSYLYKKAFVQIVERIPIAEDSEVFVSLDA